MFPFRLEAEVRALGVRLGPPRDVVGRVGRPAAAPVAGRVAAPRVPAALAGRRAAASLTGPLRVEMLDTAVLVRLGAEAFRFGANDAAPRDDILIAEVDLPSFGPDVLRFTGSFGESGTLRFSPATVVALPKADRVTGFGMPLGMPDILLGDPPILGSRVAGGCEVLVQNTEVERCKQVSSPRSPVRQTWQQSVCVVEG